MTEHVDLELEPFLAEARERPLARVLAAHLAPHCPGCAERLAAAGFRPGALGRCWSVGDLPRLFADGSPDPLEWQLLLHLASSCPGCRAGLEPLNAVLAANELPARPTPMAFEVALALSRHGAEALAEPLLAASFHTGASLVEALPALKRWGVAERLCHHSRALASRNPDQALVVARLAGLAASEAHLMGEPPETRAALQMLVAAHLANALRVLDELRCAGMAFDDANRAWEAASQDVQACFRAYRAQFLRLRASLRIDTRRFRQAELDLGLALAEAISCTDLPAYFHAEARLKLGYLYLCKGEGARAWKASRDAALCLADGEPQRLLLIALHTQLAGLLQQRLVREAEELLPRVKALAAQSREARHQLHVVWAEAQLAWSTGKSALAEELFTTVRRGFLEMGAGLNAAIATIELAQVLFMSGKGVLVKPLAEEMLVVFKAQDLKREFNAALVQFHQAALTERLTAGFLTELVAYCRRAEYDPRLRFRAGAA